MTFEKLGCDSNVSRHALAMFDNKKLASGAGAQVAQYYPLRFEQVPGSKQDGTAWIRSFRQFTGEWAGVTIVYPNEGGVISRTVLNCPNTSSRLGTIPRDQDGWFRRLSDFIYAPELKFGGNRSDIERRPAHVDVNKITESLERRKLPIGAVMLGMDQEGSYIAGLRTYSRLSHAFTRDSIIHTLSVAGTMTEVLPQAGEDTA